MSFERRMFRLLPVLLLVIGLVLTRTAQPVLASAIDPASIFQLSDANAQACTPNNGMDDWDTAVAQNAYTDGVTFAHPSCISPFNQQSQPPLTSGQLAQDFIQDGAGTADKSYYIQNSKDTLDISAGGATGSTWNESTSGSNQSKDDITNAYAAAYNSSGHLILTFGSDRFAQNGAAQMSFWFLKQHVGLNPTGTAGNTFIGHHDVGDLLVQVNYTQGGAISNVTVLKWVGSGGNATSAGTLQQIFPAVVGATATPQCGTSQAATAGVCAISNTANIASPWPYSPKAGTSGTIPASGFMEGGIDVTNFFGPNTCFATFQAETRSSPSVDATTEDFALGNFPLCSANLTIDQGNTNSVGQPHTFTLHASQTLSGNSTGASGAAITASINTANSTGLPAAIYAGATVPTGTTCPTSASPHSVTGNTDSSGNLQVTVLSCTPGTIFVDGSGSVMIGADSFPVSETAHTSSGVNDPCNPNCGVKTYAAGTLNLVKTVEKGTLSGLPNVCFSLAYGTQATGDFQITPIAGNTDGTLNSTANSYQLCHQYVEADFSGGQYTHTFTWTGLATSHYNLHEDSATSPWIKVNDINGVFVNATDSAGGGNNVTTTACAASSVAPNCAQPANPLPPGELKIVKTVNGGPVPAGVTFNFTVRQCGAGSTASSCATPYLSTVSASYTGCTPVAPATTCTTPPTVVASLKEGYYQVHEEAAPAGYAIDPATQDQIVAVLAGSGTVSGIAVNTVIVNNQLLFKLIVVTCRSADNTLVRSGVTFNTGASGANVTKNTVGPADTLPSGITAGTLCTVGGANFDQLPPKSYSGSVNVNTPAP